MDIFGNEYELPALTVELAERMEDAGKGDTIRERAKKRYAFLRDLFGKDACEEIAGGKAYDKADTRRLDIAFMLVQREYAQPVVEEQRRTLEEQTEAIKQLGDMFETVAKAAQLPAILQKNNRQKFSKVK